MHIIQISAVVHWHDLLSDASLSVGPDPCPLSTADSDANVLQCLWIMNDEEGQAIAVTEIIVDIDVGLLPAP